MFFLSEETRFQIRKSERYPENPPGAPAWVFFAPSVHTPVTRMGLVLLAGAQAVFEEMQVTGDEVGLFTVGQALPQISADGLVARLFFRHNSFDTLLASVTLPRDCGDAPWTEAKFSMRSVTGQKGCLVVECDPGPNGDSTADWLAVYECVVSAPAELKLNRARAFTAWRTRNELLHMGRVYMEDDFYVDPAPRPVYERERLTPERLAQLRLLSTNAFELAHLLVQEIIGPMPMPFHARLANKARYVKGPYRVLSLCSGEARVELEFVQRSGVRNVELTLVDVNADLLQGAKRKLSPYCLCKTITANVNTLQIERGAYDLIICVSGLHHLIELESVTESMARGLAPGGEFWSVGEYVGRNGARLWPEAYAIANQFFRSLPEQYRRNCMPGLDGKPDSDLPDIDCSVSTFESIRSEDVEECLNRVFDPVYLVRHDCLLWRLFDPAYSHNYDIKDDGVISLLQCAVEVEIAHRMSGGRPTALNAVYRSRLT